MLAVKDILYLFWIRIHGYILKVYRIAKKT